MNLFVIKGLHSKTLTIPSEIKKSGRDPMQLLFATFDSIENNVSGLNAIFRKLQAEAFTNPGTLQEAKEMFSQLHNSLLLFLKNNIKGEYGANFPKDKTALLFQLVGLISYIANNHPTKILTSSQFDKQYKEEMSIITSGLTNFAQELKVNDDHWPQEDKWKSVQSGINNFAELIYKMTIEVRLQRHPALKSGWSFSNYFLIC